MTKMVMLNKFTRFNYMLHSRKIFKYKDTNRLNIKVWKRYSMLIVTKRILVGWARQGQWERKKGVKCNTFYNKDLKINQ